MGLNCRDIYQTITNQIDGYKARDSQLRMVELVDQLVLDLTDDETKDGSHICLIEAPTGTGKSLAYLLGGVVSTKNKGKKFVISTATKLLQNQLVDKDLPLFIKSSGINCNIALAKGRGNYLCPYQLDLSIQENSSDLLNDNDQVVKLLFEIKDAYSQAKWNGDLDLSPVLIDNKYKPIITTDKDRCIGYSCPYNQKDNCNCPFYQNRAMLKSADVIVTNHSLLLADLVTGGGNVIPLKPSDYVLCLDEGHNFPQIATNAFTGQFELKRVIGICHNLSQLVYNGQNYVHTDIKLCESLHEKANKLIVTLDELDLLIEQNHQAFTDDKLILNDYLNPVVGNTFRDKFVNIAIESSEILIDLTKIIDSLKILLKDSLDVLIEQNLNRLGFYASIIESVLTVAEYMINQDESRYNANARWIDIKPITNTMRNNSIEYIINAGLTYVGNKLADKLWKQVYAAIITSATLSINNEFNFYLHKLGLNQFNLTKCYRLPTHFDYITHSQILVPKFNNSPDFSSRYEFEQELLVYLVNILGYTDPYGTLVLFFNRNQLTTVYQGLPKSLQHRVLLQTDYSSMQRLIEEHKKRINQNKPSIIFGLNSFAEGVDLPALYCLHVVITKLPFDTHKNPYGQVEEYWLNFEKSNYFTEIALPEACIKLIQATGRLIRSENDYGQITICDNRVVLKNYGKFILNSLPPFNRKYNQNFISDAFNHVYRMVNNGAS